MEEEQEKRKKTGKHSVGKEQNKKQKGKKGKIIKKVKEEDLIEELMKEIESL